MQLTAHQRARLRSHREVMADQRRQLTRSRSLHPVFYVVMGAVYAALLGLLGYGAIQIFAGAGGV